MRRALLIGAALGLGAIAVAAGLVLRGAKAPRPEPSANAITVPSGQQVTFHDFIWGEPGPSGLAIRFRFIAPAISRQDGEADFSALEADMLHLCETYALPRISNTGPQPSQVIISLSDRPVDFGEADPDATQFFEGYRPKDGTCIWEWF